MYIYTSRVGAQPGSDNPIQVSTHPAKCMHLAQHHALAGGWSPNLLRCINDVQCIAYCLRTRFGFKGDQMVVLR